MGGRTKLIEVSAKGVFSLKEFLLKGAKSRKNKESFLKKY